jgi:hypothetical protein
MNENNYDKTAPRNAFRKRLLLTNCKMQINLFFSALNNQFFI